MNIAYCIITHKNGPILRECINNLSKSSDIYVHVDKKSDIEGFVEYQNKVNLIEDRVDVRWGSYSQIQATLNLLQATTNNIYDYIFLLSGDCLPIKNNDKIVEFIKEHKGAEFIALDKDYKYADLRLKYRYTKYHYKKTRNIPEKIIVKLYEYIKYLFINKYYRKLPKLYKGTQWFGITSDLRNYILNYIYVNSWYTQAFLESYCGDEVFFHTIVFNSRFKGNVYIPRDNTNICYQALRYIDWTSGPDYPKTLDESDFEKINNVECLFARKFKDDLDLEEYRKILN